MSVKFCTGCGTRLSPGTRFCTSCGTEASSMDTSYAVSINPAPLKYLFGGIVRLIRGFKEVLKDKRKLIPAVSMTIIWIVLSILPMAGVNASSIRILSFLTFAQGGISTGVPGAIGGIVGKGLVAYFIIALILPAFSGKKPFAGIGVGLKTLLASLTVKDQKAVVPLLLGGGAALIVYNFITGNASLQNSMAGITAFILSLRALSGKAGFLRGFIASIRNKFNKGNTYDTSQVDRLVSGFAAGFALSLPLSAIRSSISCYIAGIVMFLAALVLTIIPKRIKVSREMGE